jgi:hypothetical protein
MALANDVKEISWEDLIGPMEPYEDPFLALTSGQRTDLTLIAQVRERISRGKKISGSVRKKLEKKQQSLREQGIDIDDLLAQRETIKTKRQAAAEATNDALDGNQIRMPGYVLPLEFDGDRVTEFLLVPFVGACIHVPPPPANQIVHVSLESGFRSSGLFAPVWVEGRLKVDKTKRDLFLADGSSDIAVGYSLLAENIEPYQATQ